MIRRDFVEPTTESWKAWRRKAELATNVLIAKVAAGDILTNADIVADLYKGGRTELWEAFSGKCAYCEVRFILDQAGDVEHFRPKMGVRDVDNNEIVHPGYFWLAYHWRNLLPSCAKCNRPSKTSTGELIGKGERFPVDGPHATRDADLHTERPLLIHPMFDDPEVDLTFDHLTGLVVGSTNRGKVTVKILGLNREGLPEARKETYEAVTTSFAQLYSDIARGLGDSAIASNRTRVEKHKAGAAEFAMAGRRAIADAKKRIEAIVGRI